MSNQERNKANTKVDKTGDESKGNSYDFKNCKSLTDALNIHLFDNGITIEELDKINDEAQRYFKISRKVSTHCIGMRNKRKVPLYVNGELFEGTAAEFAMLPRNSIVWFDKSHKHRFLKGMKQKEIKIGSKLEKYNDVQFVTPTEKHVREAIGMVKGQQVKITDIFEHMESLGEAKGYQFVEGWKVEVENILESMLSKRH